MFRCPPVTRQPPQWPLLSVLHLVRSLFFFGKDDDVVDDGNIDEYDAVANDAFEYLLLSVLVLVKTL